MNAAKALHTAARRYCLERHAQWCSQYSEIVAAGRGRQGSGYSPEALATFPRYNVLNAIRVELERLSPDSLPSLEETRALLISAGRTAEDDLTQRPIGQIDQQAMAEEREWFCRYVAGIGLPDLQRVEALPCRRVLTPDEAKAIWSRLRARWHITQEYWYPLTECDLPDLVAFDATAFAQGVSNEQLQAALAARSIARVWELREFGEEYEQDVALLAPIYNGFEGYWTSAEMDWIIYASHEGSITIGGWLLPGVKARWPSWEAHLFQWPSR